MSIVRTQVDPDNVLSRELTALEQHELPFAVRRAALETGKSMRERWARTAGRVFDRPNRMTTGAPRYKMVGGKYAVDVWIRDEASNGTSPARYLQAQVEGGGRAQKASEKRLQAQGILPAGHYVVPGRGAKLDAYGNIPGSQVNAILSQLGARFDPLQNETPASRARGKKRAGKRYFALTKPRGRLAAGVYQRLGRSGTGGFVRSILRFVASVSYRPRYKIFDLAEQIYRREFPFHFQRELAKGVFTRKIRGRS